MTDRNRRGAVLSLVLVAAFVASCAAGVPAEPDAAAPDPICEPGETSCDGGSYRSCRDDGAAWVELQVCEDSCDPLSGCVPCEQGQHRCRGEVSQVCLGAGIWERLRDCTEWSSTCAADGFCDDACAAPERERAYVGCEYLAVALPGLPSMTTTVMLANPSRDVATVEVSQGGVPRDDIAIEPRSVAHIEIEPDWTSSTNASESAAVRIRSDRPLVATQFEPFDPMTSSADASLLLPVHALGRRHRIATYKPTSYVGIGTEHDGLPATDNFLTAGIRSYLTIIGSLSGTTHVEVVPTAPLAGDETGRIPATAPGDVLALDLAPGERIHLVAESSPPCDGSRPGYEAIGIICGPFYQNDHCRFDAACDESGYDLSGTDVVSDRPVAVFGAHQCAFVPFDRFACDHLQEQMPPVEQWGLEHVSMTVGTDGGGGRNLVRIFASEDGTSVTLEPPQQGVDEMTLGRSEIGEVIADGVFRITSNRPVMVAQYLMGQGLFEPGNLRGDPSLWIVPPVEQYRTAYQIEQPETFDAADEGSNFLLVVRPAGTWTAIDQYGAPAIEGAVGDWNVGVIVSHGGLHHVVGEEPFGLVSLGLSPYTSYATPAGRGVSPLVF